MQWLGHGAKILDEFPVIIRQPQELLHVTPIVRGVGHFAITSVFAGSVTIPLAATICPKNATCCWQKLHFVGLSFNPALRNRVSTSAMCRI